MINKIFEDTLNFLANSLNNFNAEQRAKGTANNKTTSNAIQRLVDTIAFIMKTKTFFNTNLQEIRNELVQMKNEATKLKQSYNSRSSSLFTIDSLIDSLIIEVDAEIERREKTSASASNQKNNIQKVKVFKSSFAEEVEKKVNEFMSSNNIEVLDLIQSLENGVICITILYKEK